jgi:hypothetical protein
LLKLFAEKAVAVEQKPKKVMLPVLVVLFLISYGLMTLLVVEQGRTIDSQRFLIRDLFDDSAQFSALRSKAAREHHGPTRPQANGHSQAQTPSSQAQAPSSQAHVPSSPVTPRDNVVTSRKGKLPKRLEKPPKDASDMADVRRSAHST